MIPFSKRIIGFAMVFLLLTACKAGTLQEAIEKEIPFNKVNIIHKEKVKSGMVILYTSKQKNKDGPIEVITTAYIKGNNEKGWENAGRNQWEYEENEQATLYKNVFYDYDQKGTLENKISMIYGMIVNPAIVKIEVAVTNNQYEQADLFQVDGNRYYFKIGNFDRIRGLGKDGKVVHEQGEKKSKGIKN